MGYVPPDPPVCRIGELYGVALLKPADVRGGIVASAWDCEYCGTYVEMGLASRCPSCGAPFRRRSPSNQPTKPTMPANRVIRE